MHRIDDPSAVSTIPTPAQQGTPGFFTKGSPTIGQQATIVTDDWANAVQEELAYVIEQAGLTLSKLDRTQLYQALAILTRRRLTAPITFYLSPTGSDANDGLTTSTPWASIQHAYNYIRDRVDLNGFQATIQMANGTYTGATLNYPCIGPSPYLLGNKGDPSQVIVNNPTASALTVTNGASVLCDSFTVQSSGPASGDYGNIGSGLFAANVGQIYHQNMRFAACSNAHMTADNGGIISVTGQGVTYTIVGGAHAHCDAAGAGYVAIAHSNITLSGTPAFGTGFCTTEMAGSIDCYSCTFTGAATGPRYQATMNGIILAQGATLPGSTAGVLSTGGQYL